MAHLARRSSVDIMMFGRTHLRISLSLVKFDGEDDFDVRFAAARQNPHQISKKRKKSSEIFARKFFLASKNQTSEIA